MAVAKGGGGVRQYVCIYMHVYVFMCMRERNLWVSLSSFFCYNFFNKNSN